MRHVIALIITSLCIGACVARHSPAPRATFHVADVVRFPDSWETTLPGTSIPLFVTKSPVVTADDIVHSELLEPTDGQIKIDVQFAPDAGNRLLAATKEHQKQWMAVVVNHEVLTAPIINGVFGSSVIVEFHKGHWQTQVLLDAFLPPRKGSKA